jgi:uncharacterized Zn-binding protein involved in type VI secretion
VPQDEKKISAPSYPLHFTLTKAPGHFREITREIELGASAVTETRTWMDWRGLSKGGLAGMRGFTVSYTGRPGRRAEANTKVNGMPAVRRGDRDRCEITWHPTPAETLSVEAIFGKTCATAALIAARVQLTAGQHLVFPMVGGWLPAGERWQTLDVRINALDSTCYTAMRSRGLIAQLDRFGLPFKMPLKAGAYPAAYSSDLGGQEIIADVGHGWRLSITEPGDARDIPQRDLLRIAVLSDLASQRPQVSAHVVDERSVGSAVDDNALGPFVAESCDIGVGARSDLRLHQKADRALRPRAPRHLVHLLAEA